MRGNSPPLSERVPSQTQSVEAAEEKDALAADFMPVEDLGRRQRARDAEAAERENKVRLSLGDC